MHGDDIEIYREEWELENEKRQPEVKCLLQILYKKKEKQKNKECNRFYVVLNQRVFRDTHYTVWRMNIV